MIVDIKDPDEWRRQNPTEKSVLVLHHHPEAIARWDFNALDPEKDKERWIHTKLPGAYNGYGDFVFYDKAGNCHTCYNEKLYKMLIRTHEIWKR